MRIARWLAVGGLLLVSIPALAQTVPLQGGPWTPGHAPMYSSSGNSQPVIQDSGPAGGGPVGLGLSEGLYVARGTGTPPYAGQGTGPIGTNICDYDAPIANAGGYHFLCLSANAGGGGLIAYGSGGGAANLPLNIDINGVLAPLSYGATLPLVISAGSIAIGLDSSFGVVGGNLALASIISGDLLANASGSTAEPSGVTPSAWLSQWCSSSSDQIPYSTGASTWGCLGLLGTSHTWTGTQSFSIPTAVSSGGTGVGTFTANAPLIGNGTSPIALGTRSGSTTVFATATGVLTNGHCVSIDGSGNIIDAGGPCTTGGGGGTVSSGTANQLGTYVTTGTVISGLASANNGALITSGAGVPSISSTLPAAVQGNITAVGTIATGVWNGTVLVPTYGGTGLATITAHNVMVGEGTSNVAPVALTDAQLLVGQSAADPSGKTMNGDCSASDTLLVTCTKTNGTAFANGATTPITTAAQFQANTATKLLSTDTVWSSAVPTALSDASTVATDMSTGFNFSVTLGGNRTLGNPTNTKVGQSGCYYISQDGTGSRTLAYGSSWKFAGGTAPVLTTTASALDVLCYQVKTSTFIFASMTNNVK